SIIDMFIQAGRGLAAAHAAGLVHRDFKPDNVLVGADGRVRVSDFGLAIRGSGTGRAGSPAYMAPEQLRGDRVDARSDVFGFCVALFQALTGKLPFGGQTVEERLRAIAAGPDWPGDLPPPLRALLSRGLQEDPSRRFGSMAEAVEALERLRQPASSRLRAGRLAWVLALFAAVSLVAWSLH